MTKIPRAPPPSKRPPKSKYLTFCCAVGVIVSVTAGSSMVLATWKDAFASGSLNIVICVLLAVAVPFGLSVAWHIIFSLGADAREIHEYAVAAGWGVLAFLIGASLSGWFLASIIGSDAALRENRANYIERAKSAWADAAANGNIESEIIVVLASAASNLNATAETEAATGLLSGHPGKSIVYYALKNAAKAAALMSANLADEQQRRTEALARASDALADAARNVADGKAAEFQENAAKAAAEIGAAARIRLGASGLNIGISAPEAAQAAIAAAQDKIADRVSNVNSRRRAVMVPDYQPIDGKTAILKTNPQPLAWLTALTVELLPLICLGLLMSTRRDEDEQTPPQEPAQDVSEPVLDMRHFRARPPIAAE